MQEYLRGELERIAARPSRAAWIEKLRNHKAAADIQLSSADILRARDADRR